MESPPPPGAFFPPVPGQKWSFLGPDIPGHHITFDFVAHEEGSKRLIELNAPPGTSLYSFFDRFTVSDAGLSVTRLSYQRGSADAQNALLVTQDAKPNHADAFLTIPGVGTLSADVFPAKKRIERRPDEANPAVMTWHWEFTVYAKTPYQTWLTADFHFKAGLGLYRYVAQWYGVFSIFQRTDVIVVPDPQPGDVVPMIYLLNLRETNFRLFVLRGSPDMLPLLCKREGDGTFVHMGAMELSLSRLRIDPSGILLTELALWQGRVPMSPALKICDADTNFTDRPKFESQVTVPPGLISPVAGGIVKFLQIKGQWFNRPGDVRWVATPQPGAPPDFARYLRLEIVAKGANNAPLDTFEEELALREPIGVVRLARSVEGQAVQLFDMAQYPGPSP